MNFYFKARTKYNRSDLTATRAHQFLTNRQEQRDGEGGVRRAPLHLCAPWLLSKHLLPTGARPQQQALHAALLTPTAEGARQPHAAPARGNSRTHSGDSQTHRLEVTALMLCPWP